jgi:hypothetical protein
MANAIEAPSFHDLYMDMPGTSTQEKANVEVSNPNAVANMEASTKSQVSPSSTNGYSIWGALAMLVIIMVLVHLQ